MGITRRQFLVGAGATVVAAGGAVGLVELDVLPGKGRLERMFGSCGPAGHIPDVEAGKVVSGEFRSAARRGIRVGWSVAYPPGHDGAALPLCVAMHGRGEDHTWAFDTLGLDRFLADAVQRGASPPFAIASVDGGDAVNWHRRANGDDPPKMITDELLPLLESRGLRTGQVGLWGWSLGGYGALLLASHLGPTRVSAVAAASPALWETYGATASGTFDGAADYQANNMFTRTAALASIPLRIDCGSSDPFAPAVRRFRGALSPTPVGTVSAGCHDTAFWTHAAPTELAFVGAHLT